MCETMTNISVEDNTSYVLTEDMIDAAMTEQFPFQDGIESEEDIQSPENTMNVDLNDQVAVTPESCIRGRSLSNDSQKQNSIESKTTPRLDRPSSRVVVIETGLDKNKKILLDSKDTGKLSSQHISDQTSRGAEGTNITDCQEKTISSNITSASCITSPAHENMDATTEYKEPILKSILNRPANIESIDLCNSDTDEISGEDATEVEMLDNELQSVMESNMMAEVGLTANNQISDSVEQSTKSPNTMTSPQLHVENVTHISPSTFNNMSQSNQLSKTHNSEFPTTNNRSEIKSKPEGNRIVKGFPFPNVIVKPKDHPIRFNKIAVPHQTYFSSQGQKMNYVFLNNSSGAPVVINSSQQPSTSKSNIPYMTQQVKKSTRLSPTKLLSVQKRQLQFCKPVVFNNQPTLPTQQSVLAVNQPFSTTNQLNFSYNHQVAKNNHKVITNNQPHNTLNHQSIQPKPNILPVATVVKTTEKTLPSPQKEELDEQDIDIIKSLLFYGLDKPYSPPKEARNKTLFECLDCHDRFIIQSSLTHHLERCSLLICYSCQVCNVNLRFKNRCVFMGHLRNHNFPLAQLKYSKIVVSPLPLEVIQGGVVSSCFKESLDNSNLPDEECIISKSIRNKSETAKPLTSSSICNNKSPTTCSKNISFIQNQPIGQPSACLPKHTQQPISLLRNKNNTSPRFTCTSSTREISITSTTLSKTPLLPSVKNVQIYNKNTYAATTAPKNLTLVLENQNKPLNVKPNAKLDVLPPNELFSVSESMIIDDDSLDQSKVSIEEEEILDVVNVTVANDLCTTSSPPFNSQSKNSVNSSVKKARRPASITKPLPDKLLKKICNECGVSCLNITKHLTGGGRPVYPNLFTCKSCDLILPTRCAFKCHLRIHDRLPPYKCPDCGKDFTAFGDLYSHLKMSCGHLAKCVRYSCNSCKNHFSSKKFLGIHITTKHCRDIYRCKACPVAFFNKLAADKHTTTVHKNGINATRNQKQCFMCPIKIIPLEEFESHVLNHTNDEKVMIYGYKCPLCNLIFESKKVFIIHQVKEKKEIENSNNTILKNKFNQSLSQDTELNSHENHKKENLHSDFEFVEQFPNLEDNLPAAEKDPLSSDDLEVLQDQKIKDKMEEICIVCKKNKVVLLPGVSVDQQSLCCKQCVKTLDVHNAIQNGQTSTINEPLAKDKKVILSTNMNHEETTRVGKRSCSSEKIQIGPKKLLKIKGNSNLSNSSTEYMDYHTVPVKKTDKKFKEKARLDFGRQSSLSQGTIIACQSPNEMKCAKCGFTADTSELFLEHIKVHRVDPNTWQCQECGLCFVVLPSLERHLRMRHGIDDVKEYMDKSQACLPKSYVEETQSLKENQCRVCLEIYDSISSLEKHFRTHGMAFMSSLSKSP